MGSVNRPQIINIFEIPQDLMANFVGDGLHFNTDQFPPLMEVMVGDGLDIDQHGRVSIDHHPDDHKSSVITNCINVSMTVDGRKLILTKTFADYNVVRNCDGVIVDITEAGIREEADEIILADLSYCGAVDRPVREGTEQLPKFYK